MSGDRGQGHYSSYVERLASPRHFGCWVARGRFRALDEPPPFREVLDVAEEASHPVHQVQHPCDPRCLCKRRFKAVLNRGVI
jgi:hypothetical protein